MGYDLHITRADQWTDSAVHPITSQEWLAVADAEPGMTRYEESGQSLAYGYSYADGRGWNMDWRDGEIIIWKPDTVPDPLVALARKLGARLVGDNDEEYHADGSVTQWTEPRPNLGRPLNVDDAAGVWEAIFDRQNDEYLGSRLAPGVASLAFGVFRTFAVREIVAADVPEADGLLYQYGPFETGVKPAFVLSLVRQLDTDVDDGHLVQVECRLEFPMHQVLADLGSFNDWWFPEQNGVGRDEWFDTIAGRLEWDLLNHLTPRSLCFDTNETS